MQKNVNENLVFCDLLNNSFVQPFFEIRKNKNFLLPKSGYAPYAINLRKPEEKKSTFRNSEKCLIFSSLKLEPERNFLLFLNFRYFFA